MLGLNKMQWKKYYDERLTTAEEAVKQIKSGDKVVLAHDVGEPTALVDALVKHAEAYKNVGISHMVTLGTGAYTKPEYQDNFDVNFWFLSASTRKCVNAGYGDFTPAFFYEIPQLIREGVFPVDVAMIMVTPPDENGKVSTGTSGDYTIQAVKSAKKVIAQVNDQVPYTYGDAIFDVTEIDTFVECNQTLPALPAANIGEVESLIGKNCASIIKDGDCLQLGIGSIPDAVCNELLHKKHLGVHTEMLGDGVVRLYEAGAVDNTMKQIDKGKFVFNFVMGSQKLYDFCDRNKDCLLKGADYANDPRVICQNDNVVSINSGIGIDFYGQVASDTIGYNQFSGVGGQVDFVRGAALSNGGRSIIAMPSVINKKDGRKISKITPLLSEGQVVTTSRHDIDYVATEYGIVRLKGKSVKARAKALISIAHPDFRDELNTAFEKMFGVEA
ncbi:4-hydroxybutyrate CoA-transferase [Clostridiales Family XIII bacterium PM5-7]